MNTANRKQIATRYSGANLQPYPFLKWAGGKSQLLAAFEELFPKKFNGYIEPFVGGGAMLFAMLGRAPHLKCTINDLNEELINCYTVVRDEVDELIAALKNHRNEKDYFYAVRAQDTSELNHIERAARLIFLNKTCFNGLYRVNSRGQFNVPFGSYKNPKTCDETNLRAVSGSLQDVKLNCGHFSKVLKTAKKGDFVYMDPPYQPLSATANFTSYTSKCFGEADQRELAERFSELDKKGCLLMLSNSDNDFVRDLYAGFNIETVYASRAINCKAERRGKITELVIRNY